MTVEPYLFSADQALIESLARTTAPDQLPGAVVVDWERRTPPPLGPAGGAVDAGADPAPDSPGDLGRVRRSLGIPVICRINAPGPEVRHEIELAIELGADEILVPMVRAAAEVERVLDIVGGRVGTGVMVETVDAVRCLAEIVSLPITRAYIGLLDLAVDRGTPTLFTSLVDGTVEAAASQFGDLPFGVAGMTLPDRGDPIPARLLLAEEVRLGCAFSFMRRTFMNDLDGSEPGPAIADIRRAVDALARRSDADVSRDRRDLVSRVRALDAVSEGP